GENFVQVKKVIEITQHYLPPAQRRRIKSMARKNYSMHIARSSNKMYNYNPKAAIRQATGALKLHQNISTIYWVIKLYMLHFQKTLSKKMERV
ncbi:MAG TPA: hypothetical protein VEV15_09075, partial [Flavisolibacter sp.]|nr:hypothetical protein [Flavisolibacter sp.]